jgi:hypothetical protein
MTRPQIRRLIQSARATGDRLTTQTAAGRTPTTLILLLVVLQLAHMLARLPIVGRLELFLTADYGGNLTLDHLLARGLRPTIDFFDPYGLLPAVVGRAWFGLFGRTAHSYLGAVAVLHVLAAWGLACAIVAARAAWTGLILVIATLPFTLPTTHANLSHGLEAVLLIWAIGSQARGQAAEALAITAVALFCKPSMAYVYGLCLTLAIVWESRHTPRLVATQLAPAATVVAILGLTLGLSFGLEPLVESLIPIRMARIYRAVDFGFFHGVGRRFWLPPGATCAHYVGTVRGYWLAASIVLVAGALVQILQDPRNRPARLALTMAVLHAVFVSMFFGGEAFWIHYAYVLTIGLAALAASGPLGRRCVLGVALLALAADRSLPREWLSAWQEVGLMPRTLGLWTTPEGDRHWRATVAAIQGDQPRAVFLATFCNAGLFDPAFEPPLNLFLVLGMDDTVDAQRIAEQIRKTSTVVTAGPSLVGDADRQFLRAGGKVVQDALAPFEDVGGNSHYRILRRKRLATLDHEQEP